ncbi:hypothetical protein AWB77_06712 [Caballeronia fortuita]|uniref:Uncharacterized protein n=1 Tax=Caballeronia fortuita TaxID=1777138 RepID=A0A158E8C2_9BURK|nr:hypothetical protein [Caballeronia fortuita]SAL03122.1 hypothetical protein AWB77_06712 [Caballeronia fortuita]
MAPIEVTIAGYQGAICAQLQAAFPDFKLVEFDREEDDRDELEAEDLPALLLDFTEFETAEEHEDRGTGQLPIRCRLEARLVLPYRAARAKTYARTMAAAIAAWLRAKRFTADGVRTEPAHPIGAWRDDFAGQDRYVVWRIEWTQVIQIGTNIYADEVLPVPCVRFSFAPDIGIENKQKYRPV